MARSGSSSDLFLVRIDLWVLWLAPLEGSVGTDLGNLPPFAGFALEDVLPIVVDNNVLTRNVGNRRLLARQTPIISRPPGPPGQAPHARRDLNRVSW